jgi:hypothetical protein
MLLQLVLHQEFLGGLGSGLLETGDVTGYSLDLARYDWLSKSDRRCRRRYLATSTIGDARLYRFRVESKSSTPGAD